MKAQAIDVHVSAGRILSTPVFRPGGKKLLAKGHVLKEEDVRVLQAVGMDRIWVAELEDGEVPEDQAVCTVAAELACGAYEVQLAPGGRANLVATQNCCVLIDDDLLRRINCTPGMVIATTLNFSFAMAGQRIATIKSTPFAVSQGDLDGLIQLLRDRGPLLQARPVSTAEVAVIYCDPASGDRARALFEPVVRQKLERYGVRRHAALSVIENEEHISRALQQMIRRGPPVVLVASTTAPAVPSDEVGLAMSKIGCEFERFLAPVEPGNLLLMGYKDEIPILSAPGCYRSLKPNVIDLMLPPMLARYRVTAWEVAALGHGGLLG